jgi:hypothetical protein
MRTGHSQAKRFIDVVIYENVLVARRSQYGWHCEIDGRRVFLVEAQLAPGTTMPDQGLRGRVALTAAAANDLHLTSRHP